MVMKTGLGDMMKQAQQMQEKFKALQEEIASLEVIGESGAGMVRVTMSGRHDVKRVFIEPDVMGEDKSMLEDLLAAAVNDAVRKIERSQQQRMSSLGAAMGLPPGMSFPFQ